MELTVRHKESSLQCRQLWLARATLRLIVALFHTWTHILVDSKNPPNRITKCHVSGLTLIRVGDEDEATVKIKEKAKERERGIREAIKQSVV